MPDDRVIAGKYRLIAKLSKGGMGSVWRARHLELDCPAAVKLLDPVFADSAEALARFRREAQSAASLRSANIVQIFDFGVDNGIPYIAMELLRGQSLAELLAASSPLEPKEAALILSQVARAVAWAHSRGIIHRDLKPGNIFISEDAGESVVKLVDFGIAKPAPTQASQAPVTVTGAIMGTPQYMSPEQASGRGVVDHRTDVWSFGIVAFECLTGYHAFAAETLASLLLAICTDPLPVPSAVGPVPAGFDEWFARCAQRDPNLRFSSIAQAAEELRDVCGVVAGTPLHAVPPAHKAELTETLCSTSSGSKDFETAPIVHATTHSASIVSLADGSLPRRRYSRFLILAGLGGTGAGGAALVWLALGPTSGPTIVDRVPLATIAASSATPSTLALPHPSASSSIEPIGSAPIVLLPTQAARGERLSDAKPPASSNVVSSRRKAKGVQATPPIVGATVSAEVKAAVVPVAPANPSAEEGTVESEFGFDRTGKQRGKL